MGKMNFYNPQTAEIISVIVTKIMHNNKSTSLSFKSL